MFDLDEIRYCASLCRTRGNKSVPASAVQSYLMTQNASAIRAGDKVTAVALAQAAKMVQNRCWGLAAHFLTRYANS